MSASLIAQLDAQANTLLNRAERAEQRAELFQSALHTIATEPSHRGFRKADFQQYARAILEWAQADTT